MNKNNKERPRGNGEPIHELPQLWGIVKKDIGLANMFLLFLGAILLIYSPKEGWRFDIPILGFKLAYRGWLGVLCFTLAYLDITKRSKVMDSLTEPNLPTTVRSIFVHFCKDKTGALTAMTQQINSCENFAAAIVLLMMFQWKYNGKIYTSPTPQQFAIDKKALDDSIVKGEGTDKWCWWRWEGGDQGFQLVVSLCQ